MSDKRKKLFSIFALSICFVVIFLCFLPTGYAVKATFENDGAQKERKQKVHSNEVLERLAKEYLQEISRPIYPGEHVGGSWEFFNRRTTANMYISQCKKKVEEGYDYEGDAYYAAFDDGSAAENHEKKFTEYADKLSAAIANRERLLIEMVGADAFLQAEKAHEKEIAERQAWHDRQSWQEWLTKWAKVFGWLMFGIACMVVIMTLYAMTKAKLHGLRVWIEFISGRALYTGATWFITLKKYPAISPEDQLRSAREFVVGWVLLLLSSTPMAAASAKSDTGTKGKNPFAFIDRTSTHFTPQEMFDRLLLEAIKKQREKREELAILPTSKPAKVKTSTKTLFSLDARLIVTRDEGHGTSSRIAVSHGKWTFDATTITSATTKSRRINEEMGIAFRAFKNKWLAFHFVTGVGLSKTTTLATNRSVFSARLYSGIQAFITKGRFSAVLPAQRYERELNGEKKKNFFASVHSAFWKVSSRFSSGEESVFAKGTGTPWSRSTGLLLRFKQSLNSPTLEGGFFYNFITGRYGFRTRIMMSW
jgi:hypothetical protein